MSIQRFVIIVLAAAAVVLPAVPAAAGTSPGHQHARAACAVAGPSAWGSTWFEAQWDTQTCNPPWYIRGFAHCQSGRNLVFAYGPGRSSALVWSRATCPGTYTLKGGGYQFKKCYGCAWSARHWVTGARPPARGRARGR